MEKLSIGDILHLSDLTLPEAVTSVALTLGEDHDLAVASVLAPKLVEEEDEDLEAVAEGDEDAAKEDGEAASGGDDEGESEG